MRRRTIVFYTTLILPSQLLLLLLLMWSADLSITTSVLIASLITSFILVLAAAWYTDQKVGSVEQLAVALEAKARDSTHQLLLPESHGMVGRVVHAIRQIEYKGEKQRAKRLRDNDRLLSVLTNMADGVVILNASGRVRLLNPAAERLLDVEADIAIGRTFIQVARDHRIAELWQQSQETSTEVSQALELVGNQFVQVVLTPFLKGVARGYLVLIQDLTEMHHLQTVRQDFVANVSHELRTPLASLRALTDTLIDGALDDPPAAQHFLKQIEVEVDSMNQVVQELLDLSLLEAGKSPLTRDSITPYDLIVPTVERLQPQATKAQVGLQVDVPTMLPLFNVDVLKLQLVTINLMQNAIKFTPSGGEIRVSAIEQNGSIIVTVKDNGVGIADEDLGRIFERFYKSDRARAGGGTGLGLAIAKHIVQAHNGQIWVEHNEQRGSKFSFSVPISQNSRTQWPVSKITKPA